MRLIAVLLLVVLAACSRPRESAPRRLSTPSASPNTSQPPGPKRARRTGSDVTFFVVSDTHFGYGYPELDALTPDPVGHPVGLEAQNKKMLERMNTLPGRRLPQEFGGVVAKPRGLLITGDLTEWGREPEWNRFVAYYGLRGGDGLCAFPVFEAIGNHDKVPGPWVEEQVAKRHARRFYSWDWDDLHFVSLSEAPDDEGLAFLRDDLAQLEPGVPVVIYFHFALEGPWSTDNWFSKGDFKTRLAKTIEKSHVIAIFHGHHHANGHYKWHGIDVYKPGAVKDTTGTFTVAHYVDQRLDIAFYDYEHDAWTWWNRQKVE